LTYEVGTYQENCTLIRLIPGAAKLAAHA